MNLEATLTTYTILGQVIVKYFNALTMLLYSVVSTSNSPSKRVREVLATMGVCTGL